MSDRLKLLLIDMSTQTRDARHDPLLADYFEIHTCNRHARLARELERIQPDAICFDCDYLDRSGSRLIEQIKRLHASVPAFITTIEHSDELAVWALGARMLDFLVKPLQEAELIRCVGVLEEIRNSRQRQSSRLMTKTQQEMPVGLASPRREGDMKLAPAFYYVEKHYAEKIDCKEVAKLCGMSAFRFSRLFKEKYGIAFRDYVVRFRLRTAYKLLLEKGMSVTEAAYSTGFNDISYFSRTFKQHFETPPSELAAHVARESTDESPTAILRLPLH
jgi:AraC-like DNA-binding protein